MAYYQENPHQSPIPYYAHYSYGYPPHQYQPYAWPPTSNHLAPDQSYTYSYAELDSKPMVEPQRYAHHLSLPELLPQAHSYVPPQLAIPHIGPDPLPPHSRAHRLSSMQSRVIPDTLLSTPARISRQDAIDGRTSLPLLAISKSSLCVPNGRPITSQLKVTRCVDATKLGTIQYHNTTTSDIELTINGRDTTLKACGLLRNKWAFLSSSSICEGASLLYWRKDKSAAAATMLTDAKKGGRVLARIQGDVLSIELGVSDTGLVDEIFMTAIALVEHARRQGKGR
jgi:hypothetical protein